MFTDRTDDAYEVGMQRVKAAFLRATQEEAGARVRQ